MRSSTPIDNSPISPKRKRVHGSPENERSRSTVTIRSQKPGLAKGGPIPKLGLCEAVQGSMAARQKSPMDQKVKDDVELNTGGRKAVSKVLDPTVTSTLEICDAVADKSNPILGTRETPPSKPIASPTSPAHRDSPSQVTSALWWEEAEITGHDPQDPTDDGYGINGIGFIPTPAVERARIDLRRRQIAAWKIREAKEARQARSDRRNRDDGFEGQAHILGGSNDGSKQAKKVRFDEA